MYGRIVLDIDGEEFDEPLEKAKERGRRDDRRRHPGRRALGELCDELQGASCRGHTGEPFPQDPTDQLRGAIEAVFRVVERRPGHRLPLPRAHQPRPRHRGERPGDGVRQPRRQLGHRRRASPATPPPARTGRLRRLPRQRPGRGRRRRHPQHRSPRRAGTTSSPRIHKELLAIFDRLEQHYRDMCDTEFTIEQGKLWMLQTRVGKRTGAAALRMAVDMTKDRQIKPARRTRRSCGSPAEHLDQVLHPQFASERPARCSPRAWPPRRARPSARSYFTADDAADAAEPGREGHPRAQRDVARGRARHERAPRASSPSRGGLVEPRRGRGPRLGQAGRGAAPRRSRSRASRSRPAT